MFVDTVQAAFTTPIDRTSGGSHGRRREDTRLRCGRTGGLHPAAGRFGNERGAHPIMPTLVPRSPARRERGYNTPFALGSSYRTEIGTSSRRISQVIFTG